MPSRPGSDTSAWPLVGWKPKAADVRVASVRMRCLNPLQALQRRGLPVELFDPRRRPDYRVVVYSKLYDDRSYEEARALQAGGTQVVFDLCDNHFYNPERLPSLAAVGAQLRRMMAGADRLVASTEQMAAVMHAELPEPRPIEVIGDAVETSIEGIPLAPPRRWWDRWRWRQVQAWLDATGRPGARLVWFGAHGGPTAEHGMGDLLKLAPLLADLSREFPLTLTVISNSRQKYDALIRPWPLPTRYLPWSPETFLSALAAHDIALLPVSDNAFTRCKSNNRLALALQAGVAVVADGLPSYHEFRDACVLDDWAAGLTVYLRDAARRQRDVEAGRRIVAARWTMPTIADRWEALFASVAGWPPRPRRTSA